MKVFVTGATGFVGHEILRQLHFDKHAIHILARDPGSPRGRELVQRYQARIHAGDILNSSRLESSMAGAEAIIHLVGIISEAGSQTFENIHTKGTQIVVEAARRARVQRVIHMSALGTRAAAPSRYHRSKWAAEEIVRESALDYTIFRPSIIYGPEDKFVNTLAKLSRFSPLMPVIGKGNGLLQPIAVESVATAFVRSLTAPRAVGQTFDLCGPERLTFNQVLDDLMMVMKRNRLKIHLPVSIAWQMAKIMELGFPRLLRRAPPLNRDQIVMLQDDNVGDPGPANRFFGLEQTTFREGISKYLTRSEYYRGLSSTG